MPDFNFFYFSLGKGRGVDGEDEKHSSHTSRVVALLE